MCHVVKITGKVTRLKSVSTDITVHASKQPITKQHGVQDDTKQLHSILSHACSCTQPFQWPFSSFTRVASCPAPVSTNVNNHHLCCTNPSGRQSTVDRVPVVRIRSSASPVSRLFHENGSATNSPGCSGSLAPTVSEITQQLTARLLAADVTSTVCII